jgi:hypothetical protein
MEAMNQAAPVAPVASALLRLGDVAKRTGFPVSWLKEASDAGRVPCLRVGQKTFYNLAEVEAALLRAAAEPAPREAVKRPHARKAGQPGGDFPREAVNG